MDIRDRNNLRQSARAQLAAATGRPKQVVLIYAVVSSLLALAGTLVSLLLSDRIAGTGGLSNMGLRSILSTIQYILPFVQLLVMMTMDLGYHRAMLNITRSRPATPRDLAHGFYLFWPLLRTIVMQYVIYLGVIFLSIYAATFIFSLLPLSQNLYTVMEPYLSGTLVMDEAAALQAIPAMIPLLITCILVCCAFLLPKIYQFRMVPYCLLDSSRPGAIAALGESRMLMRDKRLALFRLDLDFWWFYALEVLITLVCYGDVLLPMVGITLPWSGTFSYFLFYILSLVMQVSVYCFFMNRVNVAYAAFYEAIRPRPQEKGVPLGNIFDM